MLRTDFHFELPPELIAQQPAATRSASRMLLLDGALGLRRDLQFQDLVLNTRTHELQRGDRVFPLTRTEYGILEVMVRRAGCVVPRDVLVEAGWGGGAEVSDNTLYVFIRSLRNKIGGEPQLLHTVRGVGYSLRAEPV